MNLQNFFYPKSICLIGASSKEKSIGYELLKNILNYGYKGKIFPVNPNSAEVLGIKCYPNILSIEEKIDLLGGTGFATKPNSRLGIPELRMSDGPVGVRWNESTAFPAGIAMAATWNPEKIYEVGRAIGREVKGKNRHVILGPCVNIARIPQGGRNFESVTNRFFS